MAQNKTFTLGKVTLEYIDHPYNNTKVNERTVEVPLGWDFILKYRSQPPFNNFIEVGAVMPYYIPLTTEYHRVLDLYDPHKQAEKIDASTFDYTNTRVLSISTIEHIATPDYGAIPSNPHDAFKCLEKIISQAKNYLITWPLAYNKTLDKDLHSSAIPYIIMDRDVDNNWSVVQGRDSIFNYKYSEPHTCGNAIVIITNVPDYKED